MSSENTKVVRKFKNISDEKRLDIIRALDSGESSRVLVAKTFNVSYPSVVKIYGDYCKSGKVSKLKVGGMKPKKLGLEHETFIKNQLVENCSLTLKEIKVKLFERFSISVCEATISSYIDSFSFSIKRISKISNAAVTETLINQRRTYSSWFLEVTNEARNILFFDETGFQVTMRRHYGRSEKGKKAIMVTPGIRSRNKTVMACMWKEGLVHYKALNTAGNRVSCLEFMEEMCIVMVSKGISNAIIVMDNASFHKCDEISHFVESKGHSIVFLPPYSPFFNPIEFMFSQWKSIVRSRRPNTDGELMRIIEEFDTVLTQRECENYVRHVGNNTIKCLGGMNVFE